MRSFSLLLAFFLSISMLFAEEPFTPKNEESARDAASEGATPPTANFHTVIKGDTLWHISGTYLGQPMRWPEIWNLNKDLIRNPHLIYPGQKIFLSKSAPEPDSISATEKIPAQTMDNSQQTAIEEKTIEKVPTETREKAESKNIKAPVVAVGKIVSVRKKPKPTGFIANSNSEKILMETEDEITIKFSRTQFFPTGTLLIVYREREALLDSDGNLNVEGDQSIIIETVGAVKLIRNLSGRKSLAKVINASGPLDIGDSVRIWESSAQ